MKLTSKLNSLIFSTMIAAALCLSARPAELAAQITVPLTGAATANVVNTCSWSFPQISFGSYAGFEKSGSSSSSLACNPGVTARLTLTDVGGNTTGPLLLTHPTSLETVQYLLFTDSGFSSPFALGNFIDYVFTPTTATQVKIFYAKIPAAQPTPVAGLYSSALNFTLTY